MKPLRTISAFIAASHFLLVRDAPLGGAEEPYRFVKDV